MNRRTVRRDYEDCKSNCERADRIDHLPVFGVGGANWILTSEEMKELDAMGLEVYYNRLGVSIVNATNIELMNEDIDLFIKFLKMLKNMKYLVLDNTKITSDSLVSILRAWSSFESLRHISAIQQGDQISQDYYKKLK